MKKYTVKPPKDLTSKYDAYMHQRRLDKIQADKNRGVDEENRRIAVSTMARNKKMTIDHMI